jgi:hypothetical protein
MLNYQTIKSQLHFIANEGSAGVICLRCFSIKRFPLGMELNLKKGENVP